MALAPDITQITAIYDAQEFENLALQVFRFQAANNALYADFLRLLKVQANAVESLDEIPFMPIEFFKSNKVSSLPFDQPLQYFQSSGTGGSSSKHWYSNLNHYEASFLQCFRIFFGEPEKYCFVFLLPHYQENPHSSLLYMCNHLANVSGAEASFYRADDFDLEKVHSIRKNDQQIFLLGTPFSLLDAKLNAYHNSENLLLVETGGMKGKRKEMIREELHQTLKSKWGVSKILGEYGMTELFSQAWSLGDGIYQCPPWMKVFIKDVYDPKKSLPASVTGRICIMDLANLHSLSFIQTSDLGQLHSNGFSVSGRIDHADLRGCNLMMA